MPISFSPEGVRKGVEGLRSDAQKSGRNAIFIAVLSLLISLTALFVAWQSNRSSSRWQAEQIPLLQQIRDRLPASQPSK